MPGEGKNPLEAFFSLKAHKVLFIFFLFFCFLFLFFSSGFFRAMGGNHS